MKRTITLHAEKNQVPQGAWLAYHFEEANEDEVLATPVYAAFTTASAAKRYLAGVVGRSRITWNDVNGDGMSFSSQVVVKD